MILNDAYVANEPKHSRNGKINPGQDLIATLALNARSA